MKFEEVLPTLRDGKKITNERIKKCGYQYIYYRDRTIFENIGGYWHLTDEDIVEIDDWEIVKEKKKVKLRDLTEKQFEKWRYKNCEKYGCAKCPVRCVDCNKTFWMSCKEMYSDKFLDQEIEIEGE